jgi:hypothetical protein
MATVRVRPARIAGPTLPGRGLRWVGPPLASSVGGAAELLRRGEQPVEIGACSRAVRRRDRPVWEPDRARSHRPRMRTSSLRQGGEVCLDVAGRRRGRACVRLSVCGLGLFDRRRGCRRCGGRRLARLRSGRRLGRGAVGRRMRARLLFHCGRLRARHIRRGRFGDGLRRGHRLGRGGAPRRLRRRLALARALGRLLRSVASEGRRGSVGRSRGRDLVERRCRNRDWIRRSRRGHAGSRDRRGSSRRQERQRVDVALRVGSHADAEVDVRLGERDLAARPDRADRVTLEDRGVAAHADRAEVQERDRVAVLCLDRHGLATARDRAGEADRASCRCRHRGSRVSCNVDAAVLPRRVRVAPEREPAQDGAAGRPGPGRGRGNEEERREDAEHEDAHDHRLCCQG